MVVNIRTINRETTLQREVSTPFIKAVLELIRGTYQNYDFIELENPTSCVDTKAVSDFLEFILRYPPGVKIPKVIIKDSVFEKKTYSDFFSVDDADIVCFSGGIDSTGALLHLIEQKRNVAALWCDYGQPYNEPERTAVRKICQKLSVRLFEAAVDLSSLIALGTERFKHIFPARNLLITSIAVALNPREVVIAGLSDELTVPDKSLRMYAEAPIYLNYKIYSPFINMTKAEVLSVWKKRWNSIINVDETVSCYDKGGDCQNCSSCAKREVAKIASCYSDVFPPVFCHQAELIEKHWFPRIETFCSTRRDEILIALNRFIDIIPNELQMLVKHYSQIYYSEIVDWRNHLIHIRDVIQ